jgi:hypothetical protein
MVYVRSDIDVNLLSMFSGAKNLFGIPVVRPVGLGFESGIRDQPS